MLPTGTTATVSGNVTIPSGENVPWTGATIEGSGTLTVASGATLAVDSSGNNDDGLYAPLVVDGTLTASASADNYDADEHRRL